MAGEPGQFDKNYPRKYPQDLPHRTRRWLWVIAALSTLELVYAAIMAAALTKYIVFDAFCIIVIICTMAATGLALFPSINPDIRDFAKNCAWLGRVGFWLQTVLVLISFVGLWYRW